MNLTLRACAVTALFAVTMSSATRAAEPVIKVGGIGLNVTDIERSKKFYTDVLSMKVAMTVPVGATGSEVVMSMSGDLTSGQPFIVLANFGKTPGPGKEGFGRVIINTTDATAIAKRATAGGYQVNKLESPQMGERVVYFLSDPDGYQVEVFGASAAELQPAKP